MIFLLFIIFWEDTQCKRKVDMMMKKDNWKDFLLVIIGNFVFAIGVTVFVLPNDILTGGVAGIAVALQPLIDIDPMIIINILTVALFFVGLIFLGKQFALKTLLSSICYPMLISLLLRLQRIMIAKKTFLIHRQLNLLLSR